MLKPLLLRNGISSLLDSISHENVKPELLVFPGLRGKIIDQHNFYNRAWESILAQCGIEYRKPYQTRHTFITLALEKDVNVKDIARLTGNSADIIWIPQQWTVVLQQGIHIQCQEYDPGLTS